MWNNINKKTLAAVMLALGLAGCGDTYRPVVIPIPRPGPDPGTPAIAVTLNRGVTATGNGGCDNVNVVCPDSLSRIDVAGDTNLNNRKVNPSASAPRLLTGSPSTMLLAHPESDNVTLLSNVEFENTSVVYSLPVGSRPVHVSEVSLLSGRIAFAALQGANSVAFISIAEGRVTQVVNIGGSPAFVAPVVTSNAQRLYVSDQSTNTVDVIDIPSAALVTSIDVQGTPGTILVSSDSKQAYVATSGAANTLTIINTETNLVTGTVALGGAPAEIVYDRRLLRVYSANPSTNTVSAVDVSVPEGRKLRDIAVAGEPVSVAVLPDGSRIFIANRAANDVAVITVSGLQPTGPAPEIVKLPATIGTPVSVVSSPDGSRIYVAAQGPTQVGTTAYPRGTVIVRTADNSIVNVIGSPYQNTIECPSTDTTRQAACEAQRAIPLQVVSAALPTL